MEENIQMPDSQDDDRELRRAFQYAANRDHHDQLAALGRQLLHDQTIRRATVRRWLPWVATAVVALFCLGFWLGRQVYGNRKPDNVTPGYQEIAVSINMDSFVFFAASGEKFIVHIPSGAPVGAQAKLEIFSVQGHLMGDFYQNDTLLFLKIDQQTKAATMSPAAITPSPPVARIPAESENYPPQKRAILVADPNNKGRFLNNTLPAHRIRVVGLQKMIEPLPDVQVNAFNEPDMRCVFYVDRIKFFVPAKMVEGQPVEIIELRGTGAEDGYYLRIGNQFFLLTADGNTFDLKVVAKPKAFD